MESSVPPAPKQWFRDPRQRRIYERLRARVGDGPAVFYREACQIRGESMFATASHQISHLLREVESSLRDVTLPDTYTQPEECPNCGSRPLGHKREIEAIAAAYAGSQPTAHICI